jgi:PHD/YefM family antitoxin component YafN of YafNO toxin-antitoxin module
LVGYLTDSKLKLCTERLLEFNKLRSGRKGRGFESRHPDYLYFPSLSNFKRHTQDFMEQLKSTGTPVVLMVNGVSELVVQSAESYQKLLERLEYLETIQGIQEGLEEFDQGKGRPAEEALAELRSQLDTA